MMRKLILEKTLLEDLKRENSDLIVELFERSTYVMVGGSVLIFGLNTQEIEEILEIMNQQISS
mgnify:CR=1 FL=1